MPPGGGGGIEGGGGIMAPTVQVQVSAHIGVTSMPPMKLQLFWALFHLSPDQETHFTGMQFDVSERTAETCQALRRFKNF